MLLQFDRIYDRLSIEDKRHVLNSLISEIQLYSKDEIEESKTYIKKIRFAFDIENIDDNLGNKGNNVETVCLLSNRKSKPDTHVKLSLSMNDYYRIKEEGKNNK